MNNLELCRNIHNFVTNYLLKKHIIFLKDKYFCACAQYKESTDH